MGGDSPELGKGLFGYRRSAVNQIISDRDIMLRQAEGRVRSAESKVAELQGELDSVRQRNGRMEEQLERLRAQFDAFTAGQPMPSATGVLEEPVGPGDDLDANGPEDVGEFGLGAGPDIPPQQPAPDPYLYDATEEAGGEDAFVFQPTYSTVSDLGEPRIGELETVDQDDASFAEQEAFPVDETGTATGLQVEDAWSDAGPLEEPGDWTAPEPAGAAARFAAWRQEVEPVIQAVQSKVEEVRDSIESVPERIRQALAPMADAISSIDADLSELGAAAPPPLLLAPEGVTPSGEAYDTQWAESDLGEEELDVGAGLAVDGDGEELPLVDPGSFGADSDDENVEVEVEEIELSDEAPRSGDAGTESKEEDAGPSPAKRRKTK